MCCPNAGPVIWISNNEAPIPVTTPKVPECEDRSDWAGPAATAASTILGTFPSLHSYEGSCRGESWVEWQLHRTGQLEDREIARFP